MNMKYRKNIHPFSIQMDRSKMLFRFSQVNFLRYELEEKNVLIRSLTSREADMYVLNTNNLVACNNGNSEMSVSASPAMESNDKDSNNEDDEGAYFNDLYLRFIEDMK